MGVPTSAVMLASFGSAAHSSPPLFHLCPSFLLQGDYHRYLAEFKTGTERKEAAEHTLLAYKAAQVRPWGACRRNRNGMRWLGELGHSRG